MEYENSFFLVSFFLVGLAVGSFLNVVIIRSPKDESISFPASHCPKCKTPLKFYHNIPIVSWLLLRGKCAFCKKSISVQYPLVELATSALFVIAYLKSDSIFQGAVLAILFSFLLSLSLIDLKYKEVSDNLSIPALIASLFVGNFFTSFENALLFAGGFTLLRIVVSWIAKKEVMGEADIIIASIIGAVLGVELGMVAVYFSAVLSVITFILMRKKEHELPFIPFLTLGLFLVWFFNSQIEDFLQSLINSIF